MLKAAMSCAAMSNTGKRAIAIGTDCVLCAVAVFLSYYLRLGYWIFPTGNQWLPVVVGILLAVPIFWASDLYQSIFRHSVTLAILRAGLVYALVFAAIFTFWGIRTVPRTLGIIQPVVFVLAVACSRAFVQIMLGDALSGLMGVKGRRRVLIYGAGAAGRQLAAALATGNEIRVVGYIDDDVAIQGRILNGLRIYAPANLKRLVAQLNISEILLAMPALSSKRRSAVLEQLLGAHVSLRVVPSMLELAQGRVAISDLREVNIEDLLGRDAVPLNPALLHQAIAGKCVMVTGAGGSIGSEICRQIVARGPARLVLFEMCEFALYAIHAEVEQLTAASGGQIELVPVLGSVLDEGLVSRTLTNWPVDILYHAAAYKHVPMLENNPLEGVRNNVFGTLNMAMVAARCGIKSFILISTDKAVRPTNVMGTSKRLSEQVIQALSAQGSDTRFAIVRFGNVLGSSGSVVPLFRSQIKAGGPVTLTHRDITRYFMTIPEAAQLVILAGAMAQGGEVFVLDMGEPVRIYDLARKMIELSGFTVKDADNPDGDMAIDIVGLRPGEKLHEELLIGAETSRTSHSHIMKAAEPFLAWPRLSYELARLRKAVTDGNVVQLYSVLQTVVPEVCLKAVVD